MRRALEEAQRAELAGEVPIGAVAVKDDQLLALGCNQTITDHDPSAHAEIVTLRSLGENLVNHRMNGVSVYVTLEPCMMCLGALVQARVARIIFGAYDLRAGACGSAFDLAFAREHNHRFSEVKGGVLEAECRALLQAFFRARR
ncbi:tRNA adenosine(34) deaminase TadA [Suttonella sp. R2A3]|uniref:tRNA adenosine(34) deaminase TadA n=1 Tax=Suttonella sp. R2A3 TaxID=2908648 RepID=UPI001F3E88C5|nr:tRNA adenosine(34) deaminase TadA [Suttonella sp. R2A3]